MGEIINGKWVRVTTNFLGSEAHLKKEWCDYISRLQRVGIKLSYDDDVLVWSWNVATGIPSTWLVYNTLSLE